MRFDVSNSEHVFFIWQPCLFNSLKCPYTFSHVHERFDIILREISYVLLANDVYVIHPQPWYPATCQLMAISCIFLQRTVIMLK